MLALHGLLRRVLWQVKLAEKFREATQHAAPQVLGCELGIEQVDHRVDAAVRVKAVGILVDVVEQA